MNRRTATLVTGLGQALIAGLVGVAWFKAYRLEYYRSAPDVSDNPFAYGAMLWLSFLVSLRGGLALFLFAEGVIRAAHAIITGEPMGTTAGWLVRTAIRRLRSARAPAPRPDRVSRQGDRLVLETDRRRDWDSMTTLRHGDGFYVVERVDETPGGERRYRYTLAPPPARHLIRAPIDLGL